MNWKKIGLVALIAAVSAGTAEVIRQKVLEDDVVSS